MGGNCQNVLKETITKKNLGIKLGPTLANDFCFTQGARNELYMMQMRLSRIS